MEVKLTRKVEAEDCTRDFLKKGLEVFKSAFAIVKIDEGSYAVVDKATREAIVEFKYRRKVYNKTWLITFEDDTKCLMCFSMSGIRFSEPFLRTVKRFKEYLLVEKNKDERKIIALKDISSMVDWSPEFGFNNYVVLKLANHYYTILKKDGLEVPFIEFDSASTYKYDNHVIIRDGVWESVVRVSDFHKSETFREVLPYIPYKEDWCCREYVIVTHGTLRKAIMRLSNFEISKAYNDIIPISNEFALGIGKDWQEVLRLSDFQVAKFDQNN